MLRILVAGLALPLLMAQGDIGVPIAAPIPAFTASDQNGSARNFASITGPKGAVLVFFRSADWCPYCKGQLAELQQNLAGFQKAGLSVAAVSYDTPEILADFARRRGITFPLLADPGSKIIRAFGILNTSVAEDSPFFGVPHPVTFITDAAGRVTSKFHENDYRQRYTAANILARRYGVPISAARATIEANRLRLTTAASNSTVRPGHRVMLSVDLDVHSGAHVYGPGVAGGYIALDWKLDESPGWTAAPVDYPQPRLMKFWYEKEKLPVYAKQVRLLRDITISPTPKALMAAAPGNQLTVKGSLRYQACDDRQCFTPEIVPVEWTFHVEPPDSERSPAALRQRVK